MKRVVLAGILLAGAALAQAGIPGALHTIDGRALVGALVVVDDRATITIGNGTDSGTTSLDVAELVSFEVANAEPAPVAAPHRVWLRSGHELPAVRLGGKAGAGGKPAVVVETPGGVTVELPLAAVRAIRHGGTGRAEPALFTQDLLQPPANEDLIYVVKDGKSQRSAVKIIGVSADRIDFTLRDRPYDFELVGLAAVVFGANTGIAPDRQPRPRTRVELVTGEHFEGRLLAAGSAGVRCRLDEGTEVTVPASRLLRLQVASDRLLWLTELQPKVEQTPAFDRAWPWTIDRSPAGPGIVVAGQTFARGIGLVPKTRLTFELGGRFDVFEAAIGIDDRGGPEAHAVFRVLVDDAVAFESAPKTRGQAAEAVRIELKKARTLAIEVDFGKNYDLGDYCVFADARVVQK